MTYTVLSGTLNSTIPYHTINGLKDWWLLWTASKHWRQTTLI